MDFTFNFRFPRSFLRTNRDLSLFGEDISFMNEKMIDHTFQNTICFFIVEVAVCHWYFFFNGNE